MELLFQRDNIVFDNLNFYTRDQEHQIMRRGAPDKEYNIYRERQDDDITQNALEYKVNLGMNHVNEQSTYYDSIPNNNSYYQYSNHHQYSTPALHIHNTLQTVNSEHDKRVDVDPTRNQENSVPQIQFQSQHQFQNIQAHSQQHPPHQHAPSQHQQHYPLPLPHTQHPPHNQLSTHVPQPPHQQQTHPLQHHLQPHQQQPQQPLQQAHLQGISHSHRQKNIVHSASLNQAEDSKTGANNYLEIGGSQIFSPLHDQAQVNANSIPTLDVNKYPDITTMVNSNSDIIVPLVESTFVDYKYCSVCGKKITRDMSRHMRTHQTESRFTCAFPKSECRHRTGKFNRPYDFKKHLLNRHFKFDNAEIKKLHNLSDKLHHWGTCPCGLRFLGIDWLDDHILNEAVVKKCPCLQEGE